MDSPWDVAFKRPGKRPHVEHMKLFAEDADKARRLARDAGWEVVSVAPWSAKSKARVIIRIVLMVFILALIAASAMARGCKPAG